jgi:hypothetical protein
MKNLEAYYIEVVMDKENSQIELLAEFGTISLQRNIRQAFIWSLHT